MIIQNIEDRITAEKYELITSLISEERLNRFKEVISLRTRRLTLCLEDMFHPHNASATLRTSEAFGLQEVNVIERFCRFSPAMDIVRGTDKWLDINHWSSTEELLGSLKNRGYRIVVTSPRPGSQIIDEYRVNDNSIALFMGTEKTGISEELERNADDTLYIPMYGLTESLNVSVSAAIIVQRLSEQIRQQPISKWTLPESEQLNLLINWVASSVRDGKRVVEKILG